MNAYSLKSLVFYCVVYVNKYKNMNTLFPINESEKFYQRIQVKIPTFQHIIKQSTKANA